LKRYSKFSWKKAIFALGIAAISVGAAVNVGISSNGNLSDFTLANIVALAQNEGGNGGGCDTDVVVRPDFEIYVCVDGSNSSCESGFSPNGPVDTINCGRR
jgi:hypothetical protein